VTLQIGLLLLIILAAVVLFSMERLPAAVISMGILSLLVLAGLLPSDQAFAGFGSDTVIMIFGLLILTTTMVHTGVVESVGRRLLQLTGNRPQRLLSVIMIIAATLSAFISNTATAALFVPIVLDLARHMKVNASRLLMPLAFATILASSITVISSSTNVVVSGMMTLHGMPPLGMFELSLVGLPIVVVGLLYMLTLGRRLIPVRGEPEGTEDILDIQPYLSEVLVDSTSPLIGKTLAESRLGQDRDVTVLRIVRSDDHLLVPLADITLQAGDKLLVKGPRDQVLKLNLEQVHPPLSSGIVQELGRIIGQFDDVIRSLEKQEAERFHPALQEMQTYAEAAQGQGCDRQQFAQSLAQLDAELEMASQEVLDSLTDPIQSLDRFLQTRDIEPITPAINTVYDPSIHGLVVRRETHATIEEGHIIRRMRRGYRDKKSGVILVEPQVIVSAGPGESSAIVQTSGRLPSPSRKERRRQEALVTSPRQDEQINTKDIQLAEVILLPYSPMIGRTLKSLRFRQRYGLQVLGINRRGKNIYRKLSDIVLSTGDELLIQGPRANIAVLDKENAFRVIGAVDTQQPKRERAALTVGIFAGVLFLATFNLLSLPVAVWLGALLVFATGCISPDTAFHAIEWKALIVVGSMLALGSAMEYTGTAEFLASQIIELMSLSSPIGLLSIFFALTMLLTQPMSNQAAAVIVLPIALQTAAQLGLNARTFAVMIAVGASCSFITPLEPACLIVYGPGQYKFMDFVKVGSVLTVLIYLIAILLVPWFWPL